MPVTNIHDTEDPDSCMKREKHLEGWRDFTWPLPSMADGATGRYGLV